MQHDRCPDREKGSPLVENLLPQKGKSADTDRIVRGPVSEVDPRDNRTRQILRLATSAGAVGGNRQIRTTPVTHRNALCHKASRDRHCDARCKAYRSGLRRALAEITIQRLYAEERRAEMAGRRFDDSRRGKVTAFKLAASRVNRLMLHPCPFQKLKGR